VFSSGQFTADKINKRQDSVKKNEPMVDEAEGK